MPNGTMPDIYSPEFQPWFDAQDPMTQEAVMRALGMDQASGNPVSAQGAFAPSMTDMAYDLPSMLGGIPLSTNSKGVPNPYNVETQQKRINFGQDLTGTGGLGNNMLSWITGPQATDPTAWKATKKGVGEPMTFDNLSHVEALAGAGSDDYLSFMADLMLNKGMTGPAAFATLKDTIKQGKASQGLLASLPTNPVNDNQVIFGAGKEPDYTTDTGFNQAFDTKSLLTEANDMFKGVAKDLALQKASGFYDPTTQQYYKGFTEEKTEQMQAADKLGLAYPTQGYGDKDYIDMMQQQAFGTAPGQSQAEEDRRQKDIERLTGQIAPAQQAADKASANQEALLKAWNDNFKAPAQPTMGAQTKPFQNFGDLHGPLPGIGGMSNADIQNLVGGAENMSAVRPFNAGPLPLDSVGYVTTQKHAKTMDDFLDPSVKKPTVGPQVRVGMDGNVELAGPVNFSKLWDPAFVGSQTRDLQAGDIGTAKTAADKKRKAAINAKYAPQARKELTSSELDRAKLAAQMRYIASQGRTPLNDQLAARSQTVRNMLGY